MHLLVHAAVNYCGDERQNCGDERRRIEGEALLDTCARVTTQKVRHYRVPHHFVLDQPAIMT